MVGVGHGVPPLLPLLLIHWVSLTPPLYTSTPDAGSDIYCAVVDWGVSDGKPDQICSSLATKRELVLFRGAGNPTRPPADGEVLVSTLCPQGRITVMRGISESEVCVCACTVHPFSPRLPVPWHRPSSAPAMVPSFHNPSPLHVTLPCACVCLR